MSPQERVEAYIRDWHQCWLIHGGDSLSIAMRMSRLDPLFFGGWQGAIAEIRNIHWAAGYTDESGSSFGSPPQHDPDTEIIRHATISGDSAMIETFSAASGQCMEYHLFRESDAWKISQQITFYDDERGPAFEPAELESLLAKVSPNASLPSPDAGDEPNCEVLFQSGRTVTISGLGRTETIRVQNAGKLSLSSGTIVACDFGGFLNDARPLSLRVPPGEYEVEVSIMGPWVGAVRLVFDSSCKGPFLYRKAERIDNSGSLVDVARGNVTFADGRAYMERDKRQHTRDFEVWRQKVVSQNISEHDVSFFSLGASTSSDAAVVECRGEQSDYPAFWVLDAQGNLAALVIDLLVCAEFLTRSIRIPWKDGCEGVICDESQPGGVRLRVDRAHGIILEGHTVQEIRWLTPEGEMIADGSTLGSWDTHVERGWHVDFGKLDRLAAEIELIFDTGYRNPK